MRTNFKDTLKPEGGAIADTKPMQFEDAQVVSVGQPDSEYPLGIGWRCDGTPRIGMYAT